ncbi:SNF2 family N-terminal domain-containing protein [Xylaria intraflava]|nr:SNF2 family N-terminal domain-containing protein [Xylaria intraflava]
MHFHFTVEWNDGLYMFRSPRRMQLSRLVLQALEVSAPDGFVYRRLSPHAFYDAAFMPDHHDFNELEGVTIPGLAARLYPFQRRTIQWLLMREGVKYSNTTPEGKLELAACSRPQNQAPYSFISLNDVQGKTYHLSDLFHVATRDPTRFQDARNSLRGGILAEEMGLGKTVEMISLVLAHKRGPYLPTEFDAYTNREVRPSGTTLIITPSTLKSQWISEFKKHAPGLVVMEYPGIKSWANDRKNKDRQGPGLVHELVSNLMKCDVVVTTYDILQTELHYATAPPERVTRHQRQYERYSSPLVEIGWWRVCLDEAQQIHSGVSAAAQVANLIPRVNSWAITGTPVKDDIADLWGLLCFLRYKPYASEPGIRSALLTTHKPIFVSLFNEIAIRHSKKAVREELALPSQKRYLVTMPFSKIEEHHYLSQLGKIIPPSWTTDDGQFLWDPDNSQLERFKNTLKTSLPGLRRTILHPELYSTARVTVYKTLEEHLETMLGNSETYIRFYLRSYFTSKLERGQLLENSPRVKEALQIWQEALKGIEPLVLECREELQRKLENSRPGPKRNSIDYIDENNPDEETVDITNVRRSLKLFLDLEHKASFLVASAFFQIKSDDSLTPPDSDEFRRLEACEMAGYERARRIRREILRGPLTKASSLMDKLRQRVAAGHSIEFPQLELPTLHGIRRVRAEIEQVMAEWKTLAVSLNNQAHVIKTWRECMVQLLLKPLVDADEGDDTTGDEYEDSTKTQDRLMVYFMAVEIAIDDRQEALTGIINNNVRHDFAKVEKKARRGQGPDPEMMLELAQGRQKARPMPRGSSLRGIIGKIRELSTTLRPETSKDENQVRLELQILRAHIQEMQAILKKQTEVVATIERDLSLFNSILNARLYFYKQLQSVSDNVAPIDQEVDDIENTSAAMIAKEIDLERKIQLGRANHRHLLHLKEDGSTPYDPCVICRSDDFRFGSITTCGHTFCKICITHWLGSKTSCPVCKAHQTRDKLSSFERNPAISRLRQVRCTRLPVVVPRKGPGVYTDIDKAKLRAIQKVELRGPSYSTKIDTLVKHLLWLRDEDPGAKSIIFTQFRPFFQILDQALKNNYINFATFTHGREQLSGIQRFKDNPSVECLLMDAKAHSSGLNLVNASHVFLCEPLLNTALELQAIARVDRIGQGHETTVWLYVIEGTVEENIQRLSERRRLAHMESSTADEEEVVDEASLAVANSRELEDASLDHLIDNQGEVVDARDVWECYFGPHKSAPC